MRPSGLKNDFEPFFHYNETFPSVFAFSDNLRAFSGRGHTAFCNLHVSSLSLSSLSVSLLCVAHTHKCESRPSRERGEKRALRKLGPGCCYEAVFVVLAEFMAEEEELGGVVCCVCVRLSRRLLLPLASLVNDYTYRVRQKYPHAHRCIMLGAEILCAACVVLCDFRRTPVHIHALCVM